ncbi:unnamed protein product, partial [marine sediment metagenome]
MKDLTIWSDGSGIAVDGDQLEIWDSNGVTWTDTDGLSETTAANLYRIATEYDFTDRCDGLLGEFIGAEDGDAGHYFDVSEIAYG